MCAWKKLRWGRQAKMESNFSLSCIFFIFQVSFFRVWYQLHLAQTKSESSSSSSSGIGGTTGGERGESARFFSIWTKVFAQSEQNLFRDLSKSSFSIWTKVGGHYYLADGDGGRPHNDNLLRAPVRTPGTLRAPVWTRPLSWALQALILLGHLETHRVGAVGSLFWLLFGLLSVLFVRFGFGFLLCCSVCLAPCLWQISLSAIFLHAAGVFVLMGDLPVRRSGSSHPEYNRRWQGSRRRLKMIACWSKFKSGFFLAWECSLKKLQPFWNKKILLASNVKVKWINI